MINVVLWKCVHVAVNLFYAFASEHDGMLSCFFLLFIFRRLSYLRIYTHGSNPVMGKYSLSKY